MHETDATAPLEYTDIDIRVYADLCDVLLRMKIEAERNSDAGHNTD